MKTEDNEYISIIIYYYEQATTTVVSPTDAVIKNSQFLVWVHYANIIEGKGYIKFQSRSGLQNKKVPLYMFKNNWYFNHIIPKIIMSLYETIRTLSQDLTYKLWHHRLANPESVVMSKILSTCDGIPSSIPKPTFFACNACIKGKFTKHVKVFHQNTMDPNKIKPGCLFQMDYAFIRGPMDNRKRGHLRTC